MTTRNHSLYSGREIFKVCYSATHMGAPACWLQTGRGIQAVGSFRVVRQVPVLGLGLAGFEALC